MTIREIVYERQNEIKKGVFTPTRASEILVELASILGNCNDRIRETDVAYNKELLRWLDSETKANRARIKAECSKEYLDKREARDIKELVVEIMRSLKYYLNNAEEEYGLGKYQ